MFRWEERCALSFWPDVGSRHKRKAEHLSLNTCVSTASLTIIAITTLTFRVRTHLRPEIPLSHRHHVEETTRPTAFYLYHHSSQQQTKEAFLYQQSDHSRRNEK